MSLKTRNKVSPAFNMSSLADIIFLLLIFFLITSRFIPNATNLTRPKASTKMSSEPAARVTVDKNGIFYVNGNQVDEGQIKGQLRPLIAGKEKPVVMLDMDENTPLKTVMTLYDIGNELNTLMVVATDPKK